MKINFFSYDREEKSTVLVVDNNEARFFGYIKSNKSLNPETKRIAQIFLNLLFQTWTENYEKFVRISQETEFRYESLKNLKVKAYRLVYKQVIDPDKMKMSITAVCVFPNQRKAFWINTGTDEVYDFEWRRNVTKLSSERKKLKTFTEQSLFATDRNYPEKAEGMVIDCPKAFWVVSHEAKSFFENSVEKVSLKKEEFFAFSRGKRVPMIIGKVNAD